MQKIANPPRHIALIPDGNRRWSRLNRLRLLQGYSMGINKFIEFATWAKEYGVKTISVWALSTENLKNRTSTEMKVLFGLYMKAAKDPKILKRLVQNRARLRIIGDRSHLPIKLRGALADIERKTRNYKDLTINLLLNYGGREDIVHSMQQIASDVKRNRNVKVDEEYIKEHLRTSSLPDVDLVVRTSGEMRLSGLLPWQAAYSELYFAKKYWPDFDKDDFRKAISTFSRRQRRFGK
ncbi:MAG: polyprenyl diphosphate synthase [Candidatus Micrarchaeales archaeon]|nr:polyprenyl diphosphate synthase [Candidatus Micrarchaeales archaeon]